MPPRKKNKKKTSKKPHRMSQCQILRSVEIILGNIFIFREIYFSLIVGRYNVM